MRTAMSLSTLLAVVALIGFTMLSGDSMAQVTKGKTRLLKTKHLMGGLVRVHAGALKKGLKEAPASDKDWEKLEMSAALLNEASYVLMADGRCPDGTWKSACDIMREGSAATLKGIEKKDLAAANKGLATVGKSCGTCHKAHKK